MCGIGGVIRQQAGSDRQLSQWLQNMGDTMLHRGPDAGRYWLDAGIGMVHRRLSIIDLSDAALQPMYSPNGRYIMVFNGEIYNFKALRAELEVDGVDFHSHSDSEVLLALYEREGADCLPRLNGMFAIAIWDREYKELFLARDRLGKKPLYFYQQGDQFAFASEIKALLALPFVERRIRPDALQDYFFHQYVPDPKTIFNNIHKLPPGHWMTLRGSVQHEQCWWQLSFKSNRQKSSEQFQHELMHLLDDSVKLRMISDVPLGAFLSGGVDSSAIVGMMARHSSKPVTTCAIGFDAEAFDEVAYAKQVAQQFRTEHHEYTVADKVADELIGIARYFDEPFADPSFVPTYFVSQLARRQVTVALAGDGGDESFAGYNKYQIDHTENQLRDWFPRPVRRGMFPPLASILGRINHPVARKGRSLLSTLALSPERSLFVTNSFFDERVWHYLIREDFSRALNGYDSAETTEHHYRQSDGEDPLARALYTDIKTWLPGDILVKVDRMSMANSLETRAPLLDYRVVELAASIPSELKIQHGEKKYIFRQALKPLLDDEILNRPKMGFSVPLAAWLRTELRPLAERILFAPNAGLNEWFRMERVQYLWDRHQNGSSDFAPELWSLLVFEIWWQGYMVADSVSVGASETHLQIAVAS